MRLVFSLLLWLSFVLGGYQETQALLEGETGWKIYYMSRRAGHKDIWRIDMDGGNPINLSNNNQEDNDPAIAPDGTWMAFHSHRGQGGDGEVFRMSIEGFGPTNLTNVLGHDTRPCVSPDGKRIVFESERDVQADIYEINPDGTGLVRLTNHPEDDWDPFYHPDGTKIVFVSRRSGNRDVWQMDRDGSNLVQLTTHSALDAEPAYSPDGTKIVFNSTRDGNYEIYIMNADGTGQTRLTHHSGIDWMPCFTPDGKEIVFLSNRVDGVNYKLWIMKTDGSNLRQITTGAWQDEGPTVFSFPVLAQPTSFSVRRGSFVSGNVEDLWLSDDSYVVVEQRPPFILSDPNAQIEVVAVSPHEEATRIALQVEMSCTGVPSNRLLQRIEVFNFESNRWETMDERIPTTTDSVVEVRIFSLPSRYIQVNTREMRCRVALFDLGTLTASWLMRVDRVNWFVSP